LYRLSDENKNNAKLFEDDNKVKEIENDYTFKNEPKRSIAFSVTVDETNTVQIINSPYDWEESFFYNALEKANEKDSISGRFYLDDNRWAFQIENQGNSKVYNFIEMTNQQAVLDRLLITFLLVSIATFLAIFIISNILTNKSLKPIKEAFERQQQFVSDASHELKTPLAVIQANIDAALGNNGQDDNTIWLNYIKSEIKRMSGLTNDLLYLTQVDMQENSAVEFCFFNLNEELENVLLGFEAVCYEKDIELIYQLEEEVNCVGSKEQLLQVAIILLDNAVKYTDASGKITLNLRKSNHHIYLDVINTGQGISEEDTKHIFDRFYRVDKARSREQGSYGLGLSIAKAIVNQHQGKITCTSKIGVETVFTVRLPLAASL
jgi:signal transduction histidine kinase